MFFDIDKAAFIVTLVLIVVSGLIFWRYKRVESFIYYSDVNALKASKKSWRVRFVKYPERLKWIAIFFLFAAFVDPHIMLEKDRGNSPLDKQLKNKEEELNIPQEGIAIYLVLDKSGSMEEGMNASQGMKRVARIDVLKQITRKFIVGDESIGLPSRYNDLIGLVTFARVANIESPLTLDHKTIIEKLAKIKTVKTHEENGTAIGYAIFKTVNLIKATKHFSQEIVKEGKPSYDIKNTIIILVTDGNQAINPLDSDHRLRSMDIKESASYASENNVRVYIININPNIRLPQFAKAKRELQLVAEKTGGKFYMADNNEALLNIYSEIDKLEASTLPGEMVVHAKIKEKAVNSKTPFEYVRISFYPYFISLGLISIFISILISTVLLRRVS